MRDGNRRAHSENGRFVTMRANGFDGRQNGAMRKTMQTSQLLILAILWMAAGACRQPSAGGASAQAPVERHEHGGAAPGAPGNRDRHGPSDVNQYISRLASDDRDRELPRKRVVELLNLPKNARIADIGCGPGMLSTAFAEALPEGVVYAIDVEPAQLDALNARIRNSKLTNVVPVLCVYEDPRIPDASVDCVLIVDTYHHFDSRVNYLKNLARVLRPGGTIVNIDYKDGKLPVGPPEDHKIKKADMLREFAEAGYAVTREITEFQWHDFTIFQRKP